MAWPQVTRAENYVKFEHVFFRYASGQTDRYTDTLTAILRTPPKIPVTVTGNYFSPSIYHLFN